VFFFIHAQVSSFQKCHTAVARQSWAATNRAGEDPADMAGFSLVKQGLKGKRTRLF
jgi:hypothetical protein